MSIPLFRNANSLFRNSYLILFRVFLIIFSDKTSFIMNYEQREGQASSVNHSRTKMQVRKTTKYNCETTTNVHAIGM